MALFVTFKYFTSCSILEALVDMVPYDNRIAILIIVSCIMKALA